MCSDVSHQDTDHHQLIRVQWHYSVISDRSWYWPISDQSESRIIMLWPIREQYYYVVTNQKAVLRPEQWWTGTGCLWRSGRDINLCQCYSWTKLTELCSELQVIEALAFKQIRVWWMPSKRQIQLMMGVTLRDCNQSHQRRGLQKYHKSQRESISQLFIQQRSSV